MELKIAKLKTKLKKLLLLTVAAALLWSVLIFPGRPTGDGSHKIDFEVPAGVGAIHIGRELEKENIIRNALYFRSYLTFTRQSNRLQAGNYGLNNGMSIGKVVEVLTSGKVHLYPLTIPEGWHNRQVGSYLAKKGLIESQEAFLQLSRDPELLEEYGILQKSTEGYLFPETYKIPDHYNAQQLQRLMLDRFFKILNETVDISDYSAEELRKRIILASIVEREAAMKEERPIIAGVFINRLKREMKLESCATIQYLFERPRKKLYLRDLKRPSDYNTYIHYGLPTGPIANPGRAALKAAFYPSKNSYLYFVVKPDRSHHFSETYSEHLRAKKRYINSDIVVAG